MRNKTIRGLLIWGMSMIVIAPVADWLLFVLPADHGRGPSPSQQGRNGETTAHVLAGPSSHADDALPSRVWTWRGIDEMT
ncbi:hypothetical protein QM588_04795 [Rhodococcus sp. IEGM 1354]|uniref:hypothetical protein n=1 Tax=Rhodococcus sp. IEGM 1354 TaxID=3047088 RepID=UPI0024B66A61|nr:hypothetical protein [Rhodococcus sp. IEGM 1354]MDI9929718.1 hypothetical protein [Rhodococcus sp. IEGM 1354]